MAHNFRPEKNLGLANVIDHKQPRFCPFFFVAIRPRQGCVYHPSDSPSYFFGSARQPLHSFASKRALLSVRT